MNKSIVLVALLGIGLAGPAFAEEPVVTVGPENGALVIMGGGGKDRKFPEIFAKFVELAGGKEARIVIVTTAASSSAGYHYEKSGTARLAKEGLGVAEVSPQRRQPPSLVLRARSRSTFSSNGAIPSSASKAGKSLRFFSSHFENERKTPAKASLRGGYFRRARLFRISDGAFSFPSSRL